MWLAQAWQRRGASGRLVIAAPAEITEGRDGLAEACRAPGISLVATAPTEPPTTTLANALALHRARPLQAALAAHRPAHALVMSFEHVMAPLAARVPFPVALAALAFRPTLHYGQLGGPRAGRKTRAERWARAQFTRVAMHHPSLDTLFSLDPTAVGALQRLAGRVRVRPVPDPVPGEPVRLSRAAIRERYGIDAHRRLFVLPGALDSRKGALVVSEALCHLSPDAAARIAVLFAGRVAPDIREAFGQNIERARRETAVQAVVHDGFVAADEIQSHVAAADAVLVLYNAEHVGSSGFLMRASGAGVPVVSTDDGLMGHLTRVHRLGRAVPPEPAAIAHALAEAADDPRAGFDAASAAAFAEARTVEAFTDALLGPFVGS